MGYQERLDEARRLEVEHRAILATPTLFDGNISPAQIGMFSKRQLKKWKDDNASKYFIEKKIRYLRRTDEEINREQRQIESTKVEGRLHQLYRQRDDIEQLDVMSHRKNGELKLAYQRTMDIIDQEIGELESIILDGMPV